MEFDLYLNIYKFIDYLITNHLMRVIPRYATGFIIIIKISIIIL